MPKTYPINVSIGDTIEYLADKEFPANRYASTYTSGKGMRGKVLRIYDPIQPYLYTAEDGEEDLHPGSNGVAAVAFPYSQHGLHSDKWPAPFLIHAEDENITWRKI
jgi:hypothetical protein